MSHVPDSEKSRSLREMHIGLLAQMLFVNGRPAPDVLQAHAVSPLVHETVVRLLTQVHLAVRWAAFGAEFAHIQVRPDTEDEAVTRVRMRVDDGRNGVVEQLRYALDAVGCTNVVFTPDDAPTTLGGGGLHFSLPASVTRTLRGAA